MIIRMPGLENFHRQLGVPPTPSRSRPDPAGWKFVAQDFGTTPVSAVPHRFCDNRACCPAILRHLG